MQLPPGPLTLRMAVPITAAPAFTMVLMGARGMETLATIGIVTAAMLHGTMVREVPEDGEEVPLRGIMDQAASADTAAARLPGAAVRATPPDGAAARLPGAADPVPFTALTVVQAPGGDDELH
jgi:hypothetical protein